MEGAPILALTFCGKHHQDDGERSGESAACIERGGRMYLMFARPGEVAERLKAAVC